MSTESERRTVTPLSSSHLDRPMNALGMVFAVLIGIALLPLLPVIVLVWLVSKLLG